MLHDAIRNESDAEKFFPRTPWSHQMRGVMGVVEKLKNRQLGAITLTAPTGAGKTAMLLSLAEAAASTGCGVLICTNRKLLMKQLIGNISKAGFEFGVRAASHSKLFDKRQKIQLSSLPTEMSRVFRGKTWSLFPCKYVLVDESHLQASGSNEKVLRAYMDAGAQVIGITATPIEVSHLYPEFIQAGTNSELRKCGAHVPVICRAPFEFDLSKVSRVVTGEFNVDDIRKKIWSQAIVGKVIDEWEAGNKDQRMSILFAPGVEEAVGMAEDFEKRGIRAASVDAQNVWVDGELYPDSGGSIREDVLKQWQQGDIKVMCNRFVLREGLDFLELYSGTLATPMGSLKSYLQATGRLIRKSPATPDHVILTDHGGSVYRHGSPNEDRDWADMYWKSEKQIMDEREEKMRKNPEKDPIVCPHCGTIRRSGPTCPPPPIGCGETCNRKMRKIIQRDGKLKEVSGPIVKQIFSKPSSDISVDQKRYDTMLCSLRNSTSPRKSSFAQLRGMFLKKYGYFPNNIEGHPEIGSQAEKAKVRDILGPTIRKAAEATLGGSDE